MLDAALRATAYDAAYWRARYAKSDAVSEWYCTLRRDGDGAEGGAEAALAQARPACGAHAQPRCNPARFNASQDSVLTRCRAHQAVRSALGRSPRRVLDCGCGTSGLADTLAAEGHEVTGVDYARSALAACRQRQRSATSSQPAPPRAVYAVADATALPFRDGSFDAVLDKATLDVRACAHSAPF
jgi:SAM-dependent methyltransferase